jgi:pimeloyl-ACP methyl ester carboxylesterase
MPVCAEDIVWLCTQLNLVRPVLVGHSMGGNVALTLAALRPDVR